MPATSRRPWTPASRRSAEQRKYQWLPRTARQPWVICALNNTVKHASARHIEIVVADSEAGIVLEVRDDGLGFDPSASFPGHLGLHSMRERATQAGGTLEISSAPGAGTLVRVHIAAAQRSYG